MNVISHQFLFQAFQSDTDVDEDFSLLQPLDLITKDVYELQRIIKEKRKSLQKDKDKNKESDREPEVERGRVREKDRQEREKEHAKDRERFEKEKEREKDKEREKKHEDQNMGEMVTVDQEDKVTVKQEENGISGGKSTLLLAQEKLLLQFFRSLY